MGENTKNGMAEREISLIDLCIEILLRWRVLIVMMLIGAVLFAGVSYAQSYRSVEAQKRKAALELEQLNAAEDAQTVQKQWSEEVLDETEINNVINAVTYKELYDENQKYLKTSFVMNVDAFAVPKSEITFQIQSNDYERTYNIQKIYEDIVSGSGLFAYISENCNVKYNPSELIYLEKTSYGEMNGIDTVRLYVLYDEESMCKRIAECVVDYINLEYERLEESVGAHEIVFLEQSYSTISSETFWASQKSYETQTLSYGNSLVNYTSKFSDDEWQYYNFLTTGEATEHENTDEVTDEVNDEAAALTVESIGTPQVSIKYMVLGMVLCVFVYVFWIFMRFVLNNKLRATESLSELYNVPQLGLIPAHENKKRFLGFVDTWILTLRDRNRRHFTAEEAANMAAVAVKMAVKKTSGNEVYLVGCDVQKQTAEQCKQIQTILSKDGIEAKILDNVLYNAEAMAGLENAQCAVLIEKAGSTLYNEVAKELELLARQDITVLGGIVVE